VVGSEVSDSCASLAGQKVLNWMRKGLSILDNEWEMRRGGDKKSGRKGR
jgi:hypothetical protein